MNPGEFSPIDKHTTSLGLFPFDKPPKQITLDEYAHCITRLRQAFPDCKLFEINLFAYLQSPSRQSGERLTIRPGQCFQISTDVYNKREDHWPDFRDGNHVHTGGPGQNKQYPLDKPEPGDIVLVRCGRGEGRGIGVVYRNDYRDGGWEKRMEM